MRKQNEEPEVSQVPSLDQLAVELKREQYRSRYSGMLKSTIFALIAVAAVSVLAAMLLLPVLQITGASMGDTLVDGDVVVAVNGVGYNAGDVIAVYYNNSILIRRVVATSGDVVNIDSDGNVYINDQPLDEPYVLEKARGACNIDMPYQVPEGRCFVMGDDRVTSIDSRNTAVGCISSDMVLGKVFIRIWPLSSMSLVK